MKYLSNIGLAIFLIGLAVFISIPFLGQNRLTEDTITKAVGKPYQSAAIIEAANSAGILDERFTSTFEFIPKLSSVLETAKANQETAAKIENWQATAIPEGVSEWDFRIGDTKGLTFSLTKASLRGFAAENTFLAFLLSFGLAILGGLLFMVPKFFTLPGIKHNGIYHNSATRGLKVGWRAFFLVATVIGVFMAGYFKSGLLAVYSLLVGVGILGYTWWEAKTKNKEDFGANAPRSASPSVTGWIGIMTGTLLIGFYVLLYWFPEYIVSWVALVSPISMKLSGNPASQWFLYGFLYTVVMLVMGIRMAAKYRHNKYQLVRTGSVVFFQTAFAFLIPEILVRLNQPYFDFKNMWPLDYDFFFEWNLSTLMSNGNLGLFMLVWGIALFVIGVPVFVYFFGKRWYCSWVCGCGGLAETMGDPYRQLSDKSLNAWRVERWLIHAVLAFSIVMTIMVLYTYFTGSSQILGFDSYGVRSWYGFLIGSAFAGVVGTGFYPLMGNRVWCRMGCPLAAYLGLVQKWKSKFRITTNGGQCISCGNCSTYCEMGIDVRHYAQRGQDVVRASCVGCGVCAAVCPRGVLRLENSAVDIDTRASELRTLLISEKDGVKMVG